MMALTGPSSQVFPQVPSLHSGSSYDLAVIGNSSFSCFIDKMTKVVWACYPKLDDDPIFDSLLNNDSQYYVSSEVGSLWYSAGAC